MGFVNLILGKILFGVKKKSTISNFEQPTTLSTVRAA
jgi:hypothetical protein